MLNLKQLHQGHKIKSFGNIEVIEVKNVISGINLLKHSIRNDPKLYYSIDNIINKIDKALNIR